MEKISDKKRFSIIARIRSSDHAWRGLGILLRTGHNAWGHLFFAGLALYLGFLFSISITEWMILFVVIGLVLVTEALNTAIEIDVGLSSPGYNPFARDAKDVAAGAVLLSVFIAIVTGILIFGPRILMLL